MLVRQRAKAERDAFFVFTSQEVMADIDAALVDRHEPLYSSSSSTSSTRGVRFLRWAEPPSVDAPVVADGADELPEMPVAAVAFFPGATFLLLFFLPFFVS